MSEPHLPPLAIDGGAIVVTTNKLIPAGPKSQQFITDPNLYPFITGPVGSGKTTTLIIKDVVTTLAMPPCRDGVRRIKIRVIRESYTSLYSTFLDTWLKYFQRDMPGSKFEGGQGRPITHLVKGIFKAREIMPFEMDVEMLGIGPHRIQEINRGWEGTIVNLNEVDQMHIDVMDSALERTGRYPSKGDGPRDLIPGAVPIRQVTGDFNPCDEDHDLYDRFVRNPRPGHVLHRLPSGLSPEAENIHNLALGRKYYTDLAATKDRHYVKRMVHGEFGYSRAGQVVFEDFHEDRHVAKRKLDPTPGIDVYLGIDASGLSPAAVFVQPQPNGQHWITDEVVPPPGCGAPRFAEYLLDMIALRYGRCTIRKGWADPTNADGVDRIAGQQSALDIIQRVIGITILPAWTNEINTRLGYVSEMLRGTVDGSNPRLIVSPHCRVTVSAFMSRYILERVITGATEKLRDLPSKLHPWSDVMDGVQYFELGFRGRTEAIIDMSAAGRPRDDRRRELQPSRAKLGTIRV